MKATIGLIALFIFGLLACKKDNQIWPSESHLEKYLPGKWKLVESTFSGFQHYRYPITEEFYFDTISGSFLQWEGYKLNREFLNNPGQDSIEYFDTIHHYYQSTLSIFYNDTARPGKNWMPFILKDSILTSLDDFRKSDLYRTKYFLNLNNLGYTRFDTASQNFLRFDSGTYYWMHIDTVGSNELILSYSRNYYDINSNYKIEYSRKSKYRRMKIN